MTLRERLHAIGVTAQTARECSPRHALLREDPAALALRLFRDGESLDDVAAGELLGTAHVPPDLLVRDENGVRSRFQMQFVEDLYLFHNWDRSDPGSVLPAGETTAILLRVAKQLAPFGRVLDVGCGGGTMGLILARQSRSVVASDINERALAIARINTKVNGVSNVDLIQGDLLEPIRSQSFDLIVSQPPYIAQPVDAVRHLFLNGGTRGDEISQRLLRSLKERLRPRGKAVIFCDWPVRPDGALPDALVECGLAAIVYRSVPVTLAAYEQCYGEKVTTHLVRLGFSGVVQTLLILSQGSGITEKLVLAHEWSQIAARNGAEK